MLYTRCPNCRTTFRITAEILLQADGQACCGRCDTLFNMCEQAADRPSRQLPKFAGRRASTVDTQISPPALRTSDRASARAVKVTEDRRSEARPSAVPKRSRRRTWIIAAVLIAVALGGYWARRFRAEFVTVPGVGPFLQGADALLRRPIEGTGRLDSYELLDWSVSTSSDDLHGDLLEVSLRFTNSGPEPRAYPYVQLELTDRGGEQLSLHTFEPGEYISALLSSEAMMQPNQTVDATLNLEDPGPQAYGFELDLCLPDESGGFVCMADDADE
jgi:predicted Zn finger-like uncharacterized protein